MIGHEITALHDIDHARTLAMVLPANLKVRREAKQAKLLPVRRAGLATARRHRRDAY